MQRLFFFFLLLAVIACGDAPDEPQQPNDGQEALADAAEVLEPFPSQPTTNTDQPDPFPSQPTTPAEPPEQPTPITSNYSLDDALRLNEIQMKGSHNSYHLASDHPQAPSWRPWTQYSLPTLTEQLEKHAVRQLELDLHYRAGFEVFHIRELDENTTCRAFVQCMQEIAGWSAKNPGHHPLFVFLELKDKLDSEKIHPHMEELETDLLSAIPRKQLLTPDDVRRGYYGLQEAVEKHGWPTLSESRGKMIVVILDEGEGAYRYTYNGTTLKGRAMFVTLSGWPFGVVKSINKPTQQAEFIRDSVAQGKLVLTRVDGLPGTGSNYQGHLEAALEAGSHFISTDYPVDDTIEGYAVRMPGGTPSRCNPITAPPECTPLLIENPAFLKFPVPSP